VPRPGPDPAKLDQAAELYTSGKTFAQAAAEVGLREDSVRLGLKRRGIEARPKRGRPSPHRIPIDPDAIAAYEAGESELSISQRLGVNRFVVTRWLKDSGVKRRGGSEAGYVRMSRLSAQERSQLAAAAHAAIRGSTKTEQQLVNAALGRERAGATNASPGCDKLCMWLAERGVEYIREKAVGKYNLDIALTNEAVAVEVLGGNWHAGKRIHATRTPYILNQGWHIVFVWNVQNFPVDPGAADHIVAYAQQASRNPAPVGEYRVIRGDGELIAVGRAGDDKFALVPPTKTLFHLRP
jgi:very-short-patch-repair endonuclease